MSDALIEPSTFSVNISIQALESLRILAEKSARITFFRKKTYPYPQLAYYLPRKNDSRSHFDS